MTEQAGRDTVDLPVRWHVRELDRESDGGFASVAELDVIGDLDRVIYRRRMAGSCVVENCPAADGVLPGKLTGGGARKWAPRLLRSRPVGGVLVALGNVAAELVPVPRRQAVQRVAGEVAGACCEEREEGAGGVAERHHSLADYLTVGRNAAGWQPAEARVRAERVEVVR